MVQPDGYVVLRIVCLRSNRITGNTRKSEAGSGMKIMSSRIVLPSSHATLLQPFAFGPESPKFPKTESAVNTRSSGSRPATTPVVAPIVKPTISSIVPLLSTNCQPFAATSSQYPPGLRGRFVKRMQSSPISLIICSDNCLDFINKISIRRFRGQLILTINNS